MTEPDPKTIAKRLTKAQRRTLLAIVWFEPGVWLTYAAGGFTATAANILLCFWRKNPLVERIWGGDAYRYRATDLGRAVAAELAQEPKP